MRRSVENDRRSLKNVDENSRTVKKKALKGYLDEKDFIRLEQVKKKIGLQNSKSQERAASSDVNASTSSAQRIKIWEKFD